MSVLLYVPPLDFTRGGRRPQLTRSHTDPHVPADSENANGSFSHPGRNPASLCVSTATRFLAGGAGVEGC
jgi:hypothetical protein